MHRMTRLYVCEITSVDLPQRNERKLHRLKHVGHPKHSASPVSSLFVRLNRFFSISRRLMTCSYVRSMKANGFSANINPTYVFFRALIDCLICSTVTESFWLSIINHPLARFVILPLIGFAFRGYFWCSLKECFWPFSHPCTLFISWHPQNSQKCIVPVTNRHRASAETSSDLRRQAKLPQTERQ